MAQALEAAYPVAASVLATADATLNIGLSRIITSGPDEALMRTDNHQPAILAVSIAHLTGLTKAGKLHHSPTSLPATA